MKKNFIPRTDSDFNSWQKLLISYLNANHLKWNIPPETMSELETFSEAFDQTYQVTIDASTRTKPAIVEKDEARKSLEAAIRTSLKAYVTYNPAVTDKDRANMGLPIHKTTHTPVPVPMTVPEASVKLVASGVVEIHFHDKDAETKRKPTGVHGVEIAWDILESNPQSPQKLNKSAFDTKTPHRLVFDFAERGKHVFFALRWENTKGEKGEWSDLYDVIIP